MESFAKRQKMSTNEQPSTSQVISNRYIKDFNLLPSSDFQDIVNSPAFVDKSLLIKEIMESSERMKIISAPNGFAKSTNMDMLRKFLEIKLDENGQPIKLQYDESGELKNEQSSPNFKLFADKNLKIFQDKEFFSKYFGTFPVLYANFRYGNGITYSEILDAFRDSVYTAYKEHPYLLNSDKLNTEEKAFFKRLYHLPSKNAIELDESEVERSLKHLSKYLYKHFDNKEVFVLIDELDDHVSGALFNPSAPYDLSMSTFGLIGLIIDKLLVGNTCIERTLINTCHYLNDFLSPETNNILIHYPFLQSPLFSYYTLTNDEIKHILNGLNLSEKFDEIRDLYSGYSLKLQDDHIDIYNFRSIIKYLIDGKIGSYWPSQHFDTIEIFLCHDQIENKIRELMSLKVVEIKCKENMKGSDMDRLVVPLHSSYRVDNKQTDLFIQYLYENGYLELVLKTEDSLQLKMSSKEVHREFEQHLSNKASLKTRFECDINSDDDFINYVGFWKQQIQWLFMHLAYGIKEIYEKTELLSSNEFDYQSIFAHLIPDLFPCILPEDYVVPKGSNIVVILKYELMSFVISLNLSDCKNSLDGLFDIIDGNHYDSLKYFKNTDKIYVGMHVGKNQKVTISYLDNNIDKNNARTINVRLLGIN